MVVQESPKLLAVVRFHHDSPNNVEVAERPNAPDCKSVKPSVQIRPSTPYKT